MFKIYHKHDQERGVYMTMDYDYSGDMSFYQNQLLEKGITKDMFDLDNYAGLTAHELQSLVNSLELKPKEKKAS